MIPSSLFFDLVDSQIAFKIVQRNFNSPNFIFSVPRAKDGQLRLKVLGSQALVSSAEAVLARLNALLCEHPVRQPQHSFKQASFTGKLISYSLFPQADKGMHHGMPDELSVECRILPSDHPRAERETVIVSVIVEGRHSLHLMEQVGTHNFQEIGRLSPNALPRETHEKLAANGFYEQSFLCLYGDEALEGAKAKLKDAFNRWVAPDMNVHARH